MKPIRIHRHIGLFQDANRLGPRARAPGVAAIIATPRAPCVSFDRRRRPRYTLKRVVERGKTLRRAVPNALHEPWKLRLRKRAALAPRYPKSTNEKSSAFGKAWRNLRAALRENARSCSMLSLVSKRSPMCSGTAASSELTGLKPDSVWREHRPPECRNPRPSDRSRPVCRCGRQPSR